MFSRALRLSRSRFPAALKGQRLSSENFSFVIPEEGEGYAVVVSKKVARLATTRHKIKRRVLSALHSLSLPPSLIVFPKASVAEVEYSELKKEIQNKLSSYTS